MSDLDLSRCTAYRCGDGSTWGIQQDNIIVDFGGDTVRLLPVRGQIQSGVIQAINAQKQSVTINVELFGRETPVEISFAEIKRM